MGISLAQNTTDTERRSRVLWDEKRDKIYKSVSVNNYVLYRKEFLTVCKLFYIGNRLLLYPYVDNIIQSF